MSMISSAEVANDTTLDPLRFSRLKLMGRSAAHYHANVDFDGSPFRKGSALHAFMLGQKDKIAIYTGGARNAKFAKYQEFLAEHAGKEILIPSEMGDVDGMRRSLERHPRARDLLADGIQEQRITWDIAGRACAGTPDVVKLLPNGTKRIVELKTAETSAPGLFRWKGRRFAYPAQVAWYADGAERCLDYPPGAVSEAFVVAVESKAPYPVTVFRMTESILAAGRRQWRTWFEAVLNCERSGYFPAYAEGDVDWEDEEREDSLDWEGAAE